MISENQNQKPLSNKEREVITFGVTMKLPFYIKRGGEILIEKDIFREMGKIVLTFLIIALLGWITILMEGD